MRFNPSRSVLAGVPTATLQAWLLSAQTAYASLATGGLPVSVSYAQGDGAKAVTRKFTTTAELVAWIALLQAQLGIVPPRRALRLYFR